MKEATRLWGLAALADNTEAQVEFGIALFNGDGVTKNEQAAAVIFRQAALHGNAVAQDRLARIRRRPRRAEKSGRGHQVPSSSRSWRLLAARTGSSTITVIGIREGWCVQFSDAAYGTVS
jgi:uncharacterized protein